METVLKAIADWIKGILTAGIMSNLSGLFDDVNTQVGNIAQQVGTKPSSFEPRVFAMIEAYSIPKNRSHVIGHDEYNPAKNDPGELFDWSRIGISG